MITPLLHSYRFRRLAAFHFLLSARMRQARRRLLLLDRHEPNARDLHESLAPFVPLGKERDSV
jgi:hypothetical protein